MDIFVWNVFLSFPGLGWIKDMDFTGLVVHLKNFIFKAEISGTSKGIDQTRAIFFFAVIRQALGIADILCLSLLFSFGYRLFDGTVKVWNHVLLVPQNRIVDILKRILWVCIPAGPDGFLSNGFPFLVGDFVQESKCVASCCYGVIQRFGSGSCALCCCQGISCRFCKRQILHF